jgi:hypothetical protein
VSGKKHRHHLVAEMRVDANPSLPLCRKHHPEKIAARFGRAQPLRDDSLDGVIERRESAKELSISARWQPFRPIRCE